MGYVIGLFFLVGLPGNVFQHGAEPKELLELAAAVLVVGGIGATIFPKTAGIASTAGVFGALIAAVGSLVTSQTSSFLPLLLVMLAFALVGWIAIKRIQGAQDRALSRSLGMRRKDVAAALDAMGTLALEEDESPLVHSFGYLGPLLTTQAAIPASAVATPKRLLLVRPDTEAAPSVADVIAEVPWEGITHYSRGDWELPAEIDPDRRKARSLMIDIPPDAAGGYCWVAVAKADEWVAVLKEIGVSTQTG